MLIVVLDLHALISQPIAAKGREIEVHFNFVVM